jgi:hypothetical protein
MMFYLFKSSTREEKHSICFLKAFVKKTSKRGSTFKRTLKSLNFFVGVSVLIVVNSIK